MELRHLRYFITVAEELNFTRAAQRLHIAQSPLSQQIRSLEEELGTRLFERTKHQVQLTTVGQLFLDEARQTLFHAEQAIQIAKRASRGEIGRLIIGFSATVGYCRFPVILQAFRKSFPNVELVLYEMQNSEQVQGLSNGSIDVGFLYQLITQEPIQRMLVLREPLIVALPEAHPLAAQPQISLQSLASESFIIYPRLAGAGVHDLIVRTCHQAGFSPRIVQEAFQSPTIINLVAGGMGIALVPACLQNHQRVGVIYKELQEQTDSLEMSMIWRQEDSFPILHEFNKVVKGIIDSGN